jgi:hypothetical protein
MAKHQYLIASEEGAARYGGEIGDPVELDLTVDERRAVVAAGWVEPADEPDDKSDDTKAKGGSK